METNNKYELIDGSNHARNHIRHFHISHNAPYLPPKILHNLCVSFLQGITAVPREIENKGYAKFWEGGWGGK